MFSRSYKVAATAVTLGVWLLCSFAFAADPPHDNTTAFGNNGCATCHLTHGGFGSLLNPALGDPCGGDCQNGGEHNQQSDGVCVADEACTPNPCGGNAWCSNTHGEAVCNCPLGFSNGATCTSCDTGFTLNGGICLPRVCDGIDVSDGGDCGYGTCVETGGGGDCTGDCASGTEHNLQTSGVCVADESCTPNPCNGNALCTDTKAITGGEAVCNCPLGFSDGAACSACDPGFTLNGSVCEGIICEMGRLGQDCGFGTCSVGGSPVCVAGCNNPNQHNNQGNGACVDNELCPGTCATNSTCDESHGLVVCNCPIGFSDGSTCSTCDIGFTLNAGVCEGRVCDGIDVGDGGDCGYGTCSESTGDCTSDCTNGAEHNRQTDGVCVADETCPGACAANALCTDDKGVTGGEAVCNCPLGFSDGATCTTCDAGFTLSAGACVPIVCDAGNTNGGECGYGTCAIGGGTATEQITMSNDAITPSMGWLEGTTGSSNANQGHSLYSPNATNRQTVAITIQGSNLVYTLWVAHSRVRVGGGAKVTPTLTVDVDSSTIGNTGAQTVDDTWSWTNLGTTAALSTGSHTIGFVCSSSNGGYRCGVDGIMLTTLGTNPSSAAGFVPYTTADWDYPSLDIYTSGGATYTCTPDSAAYVLGASETADTCNTGYVNVDGVCLVDPCNGETCSGEGTCYVDPSAAGDARCNCNGTYYGLTPTTCTECSAASGFNCVPDSAAYVTNGSTETADTCASGYELVDGICVLDPCATIDCDAQGTCYIDPSVAGYAICDCDGTYYGLDPVSCDECTTGASYSCTPDSAAYVTNGSTETADTCASGYINVNGFCETDPCDGVTCSGQGSCYLDPAVVGDAACNCDGTYYGLSPTTCDQCAGSSCTCDGDPSSAYVKSSSETCDACAPGYVNVNGVCVTNPCEGVSCDSLGTCYIDPSVAGDAICDCDGTHYGLTLTTCDQCSGGVVGPEQMIENLCRSCHIESGTATEVSSHRCDAANGCNNTFFMTCTRCHDPHSQDQNDLHGSTYGMLVKDPVITPNSGSRTVIFTGNSGTNSFADDDATNNGICEVCHTNTGHHDNAGAADSDTDHSPASNCLGCHPHRDTDSGYGFRGAGESSGGSVCAGCHPYGMEVADTNRTDTYHHVMEISAEISGGAVYPTSATPSVATNDYDKTCMQCHVDHDIFRDDINTANTAGRAANLRSRIGSAPVSGQPPDDSSGFYSENDADSTFAAGGICLSCHSNTQSKNTTDQQSDGTTSTAAMDSAGFFASAHAYNVSGQFNQDLSTFNVPCTKCHNSDTATQYQTGTNRFALHTSVDRRLRATLGMSSPTDPLEEDFCYRCHHSTSDSTPGGGPTKSTAGMDYYGTASMTSAAEGIFGLFSGSPVSSHPVGSSSGDHRPTEGTSAGWMPAGSRHVECSDCHNPHTALAGRDSGTATGSTSSSLTDSSKNGSWQTNQWAGYS
ncbi:MAG: calcium-binding EGF-like domain-containing protein, partial [Deltaproteobacteria bacterium]|nr:calcium-binding EGF-like domain-containing protein [Deltaproteobacteria bacterium]